MSGSGAVSTRRSPERIAARSRKSLVQARIGGDRIELGDGGRTVTRDGRLGLAQSRQQAITAGAVGGNLREILLGLGEFARSGQRGCGLKLCAKLRRPLILIVFPAAPAGDTGHEGNHQNQNEQAVFVPQPSHPFATDFLIDFVKDIGQAPVPGYVFGAAYIPPRRQTPKIALWRGQGKMPLPPLLTLVKAAIVGPEPRPFAPEHACSRMLAHCSIARTSRQTRRPDSSAIVPPSARDRSRSRPRFPARSARRPPSH